MRVPPTLPPPARRPRGAADGAGSRSPALRDRFMTPLTSIRAFGEILLANPNLAPEEHQAFLKIIIQESKILEGRLDAAIEALAEALATDPVPAS